jgi:hypothetical protein
VIKSPENFNKPNKSRPSTRARYGRGNGKSSKKLPIPRAEQITKLEQMKENVEDLPSIYLTAPFLTVLEDDYVEHVLGLESTSPDVTLNTPSSTVHSSGSISSVLDARLSIAEMKQLMKMYECPCLMLGCAKHHRFCTRLLPSIPIFTKDEFEIQIS